MATTMIQLVQFMPFIQSRASTTLKEAFAVTISVVSNNEKALNVLSTLILLQMVPKCSVLNCEDNHSHSMERYGTSHSHSTYPSKQKILHKKLMQ